MLHGDVGGGRSSAVSVVKGKGDLWRDKYWYCNVQYAGPRGLLPAVRCSLRLCISGGGYIAYGRLYDTDNGLWTVKISEVEQNQS